MWDKAQKMELLKVSNLSVEYHTSDRTVHALRDVSFSLNNGESLGIAGESACGKSTLGLSIIRMLQGGKITSGHILLYGEPILELKDSEFDNKIRWKRISMVFQGAMSSLDPVFTIGSQFGEILRQHGFSGDYKSAMSDAMVSVGLDETILSRYPHELSGGMKQRAVIAMALILKPELVIADEPTTALDVLVQAQIINLLKRLKSQGTSFVLVTHDLAILSEIADKIGIMYAGQMVEFGTSAEIYENPKHPYTKGLLESVPTLYGDKPKYIRGSPPGQGTPDGRCGFIDRCPHATDKCSIDPPDIKTESGFVKCWLYE